MLETHISEKIETNQDKQANPGFWIASFDNHEGRKRLHLLDKPGHTKPNSAESPSCSVIFDGVLYNSEELGRDLPDLSSLPSNDAEWIMQAYLHWGEEVLHKIKGIFALIIWDSTRDFLLCARDPLGINPLFYARSGRNLLLSMSIEALIRDPNVSREVNRALLAEYLCDLWPKLEETCYTSVKRVPPGHAMQVDRSGHKVYRYWDPAPAGSVVNWVSEDEIGSFDGLLDQAVNRCLAQGRAGIFLSGGLDSVSIAGVMADSNQRKGLSPPWALSLAFPDSASEEAVQMAVAKGLGLPQVLVPNSEAVGSKGIISSALDMSSQMAAPLLNFWAPAYHRLAQEGKRRGCQVILTGSGGDEWLEANPFYAADLWRSFDVMGLYRFWGIMRRSYRLSHVALARNILWRYGVRTLLGAVAAKGLNQIAPSLLRTRRRWHVSRLTPDWIAPDPALRKEIIRRAQENIQGPDLNGFYLSEMRRALNSPRIAPELEELFERGRNMGIRFLFPYLDPDLIKFLYRMPPDLLMRGGRSKGLVRETLAKKFPGLGFDQQRKFLVPEFFKSVLVTEGLVAWKAIGGAQTLIKLGIVGAEALNSNMTRFFQQEEPLRAHRIWHVLSTERWLRQRF